MKREVKTRSFCNRIHKKSADHAALQHCSTPWSMTARRHYRHQLYIFLPFLFKHCVQFWFYGVINR